MWRDPQHFAAERADFRSGRRTIREAGDVNVTEKSGRRSFAGLCGVLRELGGAMTETASQREAAVSRYYHCYVENRDEWGASKAQYALGNLRASALLFARLLRLPRLTLEPSETTEGAALRDTLARPHPVGRLLRHAAVIVLPARPEEYCAGSSKQTLRRKVRQAEQLGITWRTVNEIDERRRVLALADEWERAQPDLQYRNPEPMNQDLFDYNLWLIAESSDGRPLVLSVTPVDRGWAALRYFRTIGQGTEQSVARYYLTNVLVCRLCRLGAHHLVDATSPSSLTNGLRHYQRTVGFRIFRVRVRRAAAKRAR